MATGLAPIERDSIRRVLDVLEAENVATSDTAPAVLWGDWYEALDDLGRFVLRTCEPRPPWRVSGGEMSRVLATATVLVLCVAVPAAVTAQKPPKQPKQPGQLSLSGAPNPVKFGKSVTISGKLTGPGKAKKEVTLSEDPFPVDDLTRVGTATVDDQGDYSFVRSPTVNTRYQTRQGGLESEILTVSVSPRVSLRVGDRTPAAGKRVRLSGRVCPQHDGASLAIQRRRAPRRWRTVAQVVTAEAGDECSTYRRRRRVRRDGVYRTFFSGDADHAAASSRARRIDVH